MGLDETYVKDAAQAIAEQVHRRGHTAELAYTPGNMTMYDLVFVPFSDGIPDRLASWMDDSRRRSIFEDRPELERDGVVLVCWLGHGSWPVDLRDVPAPSYLLEKFDRCTSGDAEAICVLLYEVALQTRLATLRAV